MRFRISLLENSVISLEMSKLVSLCHSLFSSCLSVPSFGGRAFPLWICWPEERRRHLLHELRPATALHTAWNHRFHPQRGEGRRGLFVSYTHAQPHPLKKLATLLLPLTTSFFFWCVCMCVCVCVCVCVYVCLYVGYFLRFKRYLAIFLRANCSTSLPRAFGSPSKLRVSRLTFTSTR